MSDKKIEQKDFTCHSVGDDFFNEIEKLKKFLSLNKIKKLLKNY